ncbi:hypothetical protein BTR14_13245 [Rhizobium rhizosphaerae]|uniref:DUF222 domain-containing protein n=1 Tax=Xaviernesmea rhizosphaerae TaxID=1672749 RepID=A0ABX3PDB9_9HYPH|nr:hypothetical protein [Xaviernesmea rhizosphaerae]OQP86043.1 hypothetical protein BTR14_13245 [Xaviernesmea rhizosphaerae]
MSAISKAAASANRARPFYEEHDISKELKSMLEEEAKLLIGTRRRSTEDAFEEGERFERIATLLPEGTLEKWAVECCGYTARHVRTKRAVHRNLQAYKGILVALAVGPTVLGKMSAATPEQVEQIIGFASMHDRLRVQDVTAIMAGSTSDTDETPAVDPHDAGGLEGLKAIIAIKVRDGMKEFAAHVEEILTHVAEALEKKNIVKTKLEEQIVLTARLASHELRSLVEFVAPNEKAAYVIDPIRLPAGSRWAAVSALLYKISSDTTWPGKAELRTWLETEVVPTLTWATAKKPVPTDPDATIPDVAMPLAEAVVAEPSEALEPAASGARSIKDAVTSVAAAFGVDANVDVSIPKKLEEDTIPTVTEALAAPKKQFQRPTILNGITPAAPPAAAV